MHALITGAGGFVGGAIARAGLAAGWRVTAVCRKRRPAALAACPGIEIVATDLRDCSNLPDRYDYLVHCAAEVPAYCPDPEKLYRGNVDAMRCVLDHAR